MKRTRTRGLEMQSPISEWRSSKRHLRYFAWTVALGLALSVHYRPSGQQAYVALAAALVFALGTVLPQAFRYVYALVLTPLVWLAILAAAVVLNIPIRSALGLFRRGV